MLARLIRRTLGSQIRRNMVLSGLANIISMAVGLVFYPIALHYLGFEVYGIWLAVSIVLTLSQLGGIGLAPAVTKRVAESIGLGDAREAEATVACGHAFTLPLGVVISLMVWFLNRPLISFFDLSVSSTQLALEAVPWVGFLSGYAVFAQISQAALAGVGRTDIVSALTAGGRFLFLLVAWSLMASDWGLYSLIAGSWLETAAVQLATILFLRRYAAMHAFRWSLVQRETARELITFGSGVLGLNAMQLLLTPLNRALLSRYAGIQSV